MKDKVSSLTQSVMNHLDEEGIEHTYFMVSEFVSNFITDTVDWDELEQALIDELDYLGGMEQ